MRKMLTLLFLIVNFYLIHGQVLTAKDSLLRLLAKAKDDTAKVLLLYAIGDTYESSSPDKAKEYFLQGGKLSKKINYRVGTQKFYRHLSYTYVVQSKYDSVLYYNKLGLELARIRSVLAFRFSILALLTVSCPITRMQFCITSKGPNYWKERGIPILNQAYMMGCRYFT
jgi:hypothetical protein